LLLHCSLIKREGLLLSTARPHFPKCLFALLPSLTRAHRHALCRWPAFAEVVCPRPSSAHCCAVYSLPRHRRPRPQKASALARRVPSLTPSAHGASQTSTPRPVPISPSGSRRRCFSLSSSAAAAADMPFGRPGGSSCRVSHPLACPAPCASRSRRDPVSPSPEATRRGISLPAAVPNAVLSSGLRTNQP
jgi:hypothetical protein